MLDLATIGQEIAARRKRARLTQARLAERSGVSRATIAALETGAIGELGFGKTMRVLAVLGLDLRLTVANARRPTLEDLQAERDLP